MITINASVAGYSPEAKTHLLRHEQIHATQDFSDLHPEVSRSSEELYAENILLEGTTETLACILSEGQIPTSSAAYHRHMAMVLALVSKTGSEPQQTLLEINQLADKTRLAWFREQIPDLPDDLAERIDHFISSPHPRDAAAYSGLLQPKIDEAIALLDAVTWSSDGDGEEEKEACIID